MPEKTIRNLSEIAMEIKRDWPKPYFGAIPYLDAMLSLDSVAQNFYEDSGATVVNYFLANAQTWRGENAKRIKAELKWQLALLDKGQFSEISQQQKREDHTP